jgi:hypothetical protein
MIGNLVLIQKKFKLYPIFTRFILLSTVIEEYAFKEHRNIRIEL